MSKAVAKIIAALPGDTQLTTGVGTVTPDELVASLGKGPSIKYLTTRQAAAMFGGSVKVWRNRAHGGLLPGARRVDGGGYHIPVDACETYIQGQPFGARQRQPDGTKEGNAKRPRRRTTSTEGRS